MYDPGSPSLLSAILQRDRLKALTLTQPWASLVASGAKQTETRSWGVEYCGPLVIHAAKGYPAEAEALCEEEPFSSALEAAGYHRHAERGSNLWGLPLGAIIAIVQLEQVERITSYLHVTPQERAFGNYAPGRYAWQFGEVYRLPSLPRSRHAGRWDCGVGNPRSRSGTTCKLPSISSALSLHMSLEDRQKQRSPSNSCLAADGRASQAIPTSAMQRSSLCYSTRDSLCMASAKEHSLMNHTSEAAHAVPASGASERDTGEREQRRPAYCQHCSTLVYLKGHPQHPWGPPSWLTPKTPDYDQYILRVGYAEVDRCRTAFFQGWDDGRGNHWCGYCYANYQLMMLGEQLGYPDAYALYAEASTRNTSGYDAWLQLARTAGGVLIASVARAASARLAEPPSTITASFHSTVYTLGYRTPGAMEQLQSRVQAGALLCDIRLVPLSRRYPVWRKETLAAHFGSSYCHLPALGNLNYRNPGQPIRLQDAMTGMQTLTDILRERDIVLLCGCPDPATCHRSEVCSQLHTHLPHVSIIHLVYTPSAQPCWQERPLHRERRAS